MNKFFNKFLSLLVLLGSSLLIPFNVIFADASYDFESDTIGTTPAGITVTAGTFDVQNDDILGKSMRAVTQVGVIAGAIFDNFGTSSDQQVVWKQSYSSNLGRSGFTLRAQDTDTGVINSVGAKQGYLFHVYSSGSVYIWEVGPSSYTALWSGSLSKVEPRWFRASAVGTDLTFEYSNDGTNYTTLATVSDSTYTSGKVQYTAGYGASVGVDYIDDIIITNLDPEVIDPVVSSFSPSDNATSVSIDSNLSIYFSESVEIQTGYINIYRTSNNSLVESIDVTGDQVTGTGTDTITINPSQNLNENTGYYIQIDATAFDDVVGNSYAGISDTTTWNFTTILEETNSSSSGTYRGCKDPKAINYEKFSAHRQELCQYETVQDISKVSVVNIRDLKKGMKGDDVKQLQNLLIQQGYSIPAGSTGLFLNQTESALSEYQKKHNINPSVGYFGPITRSVMKSLQTPGLWW